MQLPENPLLVVENQLWRVRDLQRWTLGEIKDETTSLGEATSRFADE